MQLLKSAVAGAALALGISTAALAQTTIFYGHSGPARGTVPIALSWFGERIGELSKGDLKLDIQWGGALFKAPAAVQGVSNGVADAGSIISAYFQKEMAAYSLADLPVSGPNVWVGLRATDKLMRSVPEIAEHLARQNLVYIGTFTASDVNVACRGEGIASLEDIKGKKVRGAGVYGKVFKELGATMVNLSVYEAYQGLDTGLIDCSQGYSYIIPALKWHEVIDSYTLLNWGQIGGYGMFMNKQVYDGLTDMQRAVLDQAGQELADQFARIVIGANAEALKTLSADGFERDIKLLSLSNEERQELNAATEPFLADWKANAESVGLNPDELISVYSEAVAHYTKEFEEKGYPWQQD